MDIAEVGKRFRELFGDGLFGDAGRREEPAYEMPYPCGGTPSNHCAHCPAAPGTKCLPPKGPPRNTR